MELSKESVLELIEAQTKTVASRSVDEFRHGGDAPVSVPCLDRPAPIEGKIPSPLLLGFIGPDLLWLLWLLSLFL